jgi:hypothetical protein
MKRWDYTLEGTTCSLCVGRGTTETAGDLHKSSGVIPCPRRYFQGHGYPMCVNGKLAFSQYDRDNETRLRRKQV